MSRSDIGETASELRRAAFQTVFGYVVCRVLVKGQYYRDFARVCTPLKTQKTHLHKRKHKNNGPFLVQTPQQFSEISVFDPGWPGCMEMAYNVRRTFSSWVLVSCENHWKLIMVCSLCKNSLYIFLLVSPEHCVWERRHLIIILPKFWRNTSKIPVIQLL